MDVYSIVQVYPKKNGKNRVLSVSGHVWRVRGGTIDSKLTDDPVGSLRVGEAPSGKGSRDLVPSSCTPHDRFLLAIPLFRFLLVSLANESGTALGRFRVGVAVCSGDRSVRITLLEKTRVRFGKRVNDPENYSTRIMIMSMITIVEV